MAVAIDQILRLAPSINWLIEPVVSSTKATSTVGRAMAEDRPAGNGRTARAKASELRVMRDLMGLLQGFVPGTKVPSASRWAEGGIGAKLRCESASNAILAA